MYVSNEERIFDFKLKRFYMMVVLTCCSVNRIRFDMSMKVQASKGITTLPAQRKDNNSDDFAI